MNSRIERLSALVLKYDKELQNENEKLVGMLAAQVRNYDVLTGTFPKLREEIKEEVAKLEAGQQSAIKGQLDLISKLSDEVKSRCAELSAESKKDIEETQAGAAELVAGLAKQTATAIDKLTEEATKRAEIVARSIASLAENSGSFIDLYRGTFKPGVSKAKRGELWTYYGNTLLCMADTTKQPMAFGNTDKIPGWQIIAASGAPGPAGASGSGGGGSGAWGGITGTLSDQTDLQAALDAKANLSGVNTFDGSVIRTPATITISEASPDTGAIDITKGYSQATIDEATTLTPSAVGTNGQYVILDVTNSGSADYVVTVDTATDFTFTAAAGSTTTVLLRSNGSGWVLVGGDPYKLEDLATFVIDGGGLAITAGTVSGTKRIPFNCRLVGYSICATAATGTNTVKFWAKVNGTAIPTISDVINTSGISLTTGTAVRSTTVADIADFTDTVFAANDMIRCAVTLVDTTATDISVTLIGVRV